MKTQSVIGGAAVVVMGVGLFLAIEVPPEQVQGDFVKMLFIHVPSVMIAYLAFTVGLVGSLAYLATKNTSADRLAAASIEIGVVFTMLTLATGMIWGRPTWGVWWDWGDARMVSALFMLFFYLGYLALRRGVTDPKTRAGRTAVLGVVAFVQVPIVHFSVTWFRTLHQPATLFRPDVGNAPLDSVFVPPLLTALAAFLLVYLAFIRARYRLADRQDELAAAQMTSELAGSAVAEPILGGVHE